MGTTADSVLRLVGPHFSPNHTALYLERTLFLLAGFVWASRGNWRWDQSCGVGVYVARARCSQRAGAPGCWACPWARLVLLCWSDPDQQRTSQLLQPGRVWCGSAVAALAFIAIMAIGVVGFGWERLSNQATVLDRMAIWRSSAALWRDFPAGWRRPWRLLLALPGLSPAGVDHGPQPAPPTQSVVRVWQHVGRDWAGLDHLRPGRRVVLIEAALAPLAGRSHRMDGLSADRGRSSCRPGRRCCPWTGRCLWRLCQTWPHGTGPRWDYSRYL